MSETAKASPAGCGCLAVLLVVFGGGIWGCVACLNSTTPTKAPAQQKAVAESSPQPLPEPTPAEMRTVRKNIASSYEESALARGLDFHVRAQGKNADLLYIEFALMSRPMAYQIFNDDSTMKVWRDAGFKKIVCADDEGAYWSEAFN